MKPHFTNTSNLIDFPKTEKMMNERIIELANQAWEYAHRNSQDGDGQFGWLYRDKFAELIVRECIEVLRMVSYDCDGPEFGDEVVYQNAIKKHFGVEE